MTTPPTDSSATSQSSTTTSSSSSKPAAVKPPSLHQLAARININNVNNVSSSSNTVAPRPRLPANILRTGSAAPSLHASNASTTTVDSMVVNAPTTRSVSPATTTLSTSPPQSNTPSNDAASDVKEGEPLTAENLKELNEETQEGQQESSSRSQAQAQMQPPKQRMPMGYKGVPSLDAITARLVKTRTLSIDGSANPPEPELVEDPKTPGVKIKAPEHPLQFSWIIYHDTKANVPFTPATATIAPNSSVGSSFPPPDNSADYEAGLTVIGEFNTVESFCRYFNWLKPPSKLERNSNYHIFKSGIKPMWEDPANASGGKWVLTMKNNPELLNRCWNWLAMALVGEQLEEGDDICGAVVSLRSKVDRIQVWTRSKEEVEKLNGIGKRLVKLLDVSEADGIGFEFQYNTEDRPLPNKFLSIHAMPTSSYRSNFQQNNPTMTPTNTTAMSPNPSLPGGAFGNFGAGMGVGSWKAPVKRTT
ncbi:hypothetical protein M378DRAFT_162733 [Amanita muscaria Koide BX008]|uniref:Translation initiation factor eIF4e n=1 Tax=Amanita muscaria (strain Koide BX008) TaxID=946122 RepID=A0A0C2SNQ2_AMAMK|nr:hypothetical protein M378DRAFT_162733 [Amanita muscaria Koide BX008]